MSWSVPSCKHTGRCRATLSVPAGWLADHYSSRIAVDMTLSASVDGSRFLLLLFPWKQLQDGNYGTRWIL
jgi:hypothetical protein